MGFDIATLEAQLAQVQALKAQILSGGLSAIQQPSSWRVGEVTFTKGGAGSKSWLNLKDLIEIEKELMEMMQNLFPSEVPITHQSAVDAYGRDFTDYFAEED